MLQSHVFFSFKKCQITKIIYFHLLPGPKPDNIGCLTPFNHIFPTAPREIDYLFGMPIPTLRAVVTHSKLGGDEVEEASCARAQGSERTGEVPASLLKSTATIFIRSPSKIATRVQNYPHFKCMQFLGPFRAILSFPLLPSQVISNVRTHLTS